MGKEPVKKVNELVSGVVRLLPVGSLEAFSRYVRVTHIKKKKKSIWPGMVGHSCNSRYSGGRGRMIKVQGWPGQKLETISEKQAKAKGLGHGSSRPALT
jgi:hypothetical protein